MEIKNIKKFLMQKSFHKNKMIIISFIILLMLLIVTASLAYYLPIAVNKTNKKIVITDYKLDVTYENDSRLIDTEATNYEKTFTVTNNTNDTVYYGVNLGALSTSKDITFTLSRKASADTSYTDLISDTITAKTNEENVPISDLQIIEPGVSYVYKISISNSSENKVSTALFLEDISEVYTLTFNANGGNVNMTSKNVAYGYYIGTLPTINFSDDDVTFEGWVIDGNTAKKIEATIIYEEKSDNQINALLKGTTPDIKITFASSIPNDAGYNIGTACSGTWSYTNNRLEFAGGTSLPQNCVATFNKESKILLSDVVKSKATNLTSSTYNKAGYRYIGINPNNYVRFNGELWRIIGYVPACVGEDACTSTPTDMRVKIIRDSAIGSYAFDGRGSSGSQTFDKAVISTLLNDTYLNNKIAASNNYGYYGAPATADFRGIGLRSVTNMIEKVHFGVGVSPFSYAKDLWNNEYKSSTEKLSVGIPSAADFAFASSGCYSSTTSVNDYKGATCSGTDWLNTYMWFLTPYDEWRYNIMAVYKSGYIEDYTDYNSFPIRPVVYLQSDVRVMNYDANNSKLGQADNPYELSR